MSSVPEIPFDSREAFHSRELSWLAFARRVLAQAESDELPLLERVKFAGIVGMLHDEFFMKRVSGLKRLVAKGSKKTNINGRTAGEELAACREEIDRQLLALSALLDGDLLPRLESEGLGIRDYSELDADQQQRLRRYFQESVQPILTPLAVDKEHPFPFISNLGLNLAVELSDDGHNKTRFVRVKVPNNRPRWVDLGEGQGFARLEQVIAANLDLLVPRSRPERVFYFRVTRGAEAPAEAPDLSLAEALDEPGSIVRQVSSELKARRFAGVVRLEVDAEMPKKRVKWLAGQLDIAKQDVLVATSLLRISDLMQFRVEGRDDLRYADHRPAPPRRLAHLDPDDPGAIFREIRRGDVLVHHPYESFDSSVLRLLQSAALDPAVLAIKLTIYRTSRDSPTVLALAEAARRGKQVAVLVEITARFDEAPNIAWGKYLEKEGAHVSYGVEKLKTHVKLALVIREESDGIRRYVHAGTGNYHSGTARVYEDIGILTCDRDICDDVTALFNSLTGATPGVDYKKLLVAPSSMRRRFLELIRREAGNAGQGKAAGIQAKMNQLQDPEIIRELYSAGRAGVPIRLNVRGLCCLRAGVPGLSENIRVFSVVGRFLEHSRIYRFENDGEPEFYIGSTDWMKRNLDNRVESIVPAEDERVKARLGRILATYEDDNTSAWDALPDGTYRRRQPGPGEPRRAAQEMFLEAASTAGRDNRAASGAG